MGYVPAMTSFTRMVDATPEDYGVIARHALGFQQGLPDRVLRHLALLAGDTGGYAVDRLTHSLQTATRAHRDGRDEEYVVCALVHDVGDTLASLNHSELAAVVVQPFVSEENHWIVKHHGVFQGYYFFHHMGLDARSVTCRELVVHPLVIGAVGKVLGHATSFQLHLTQVIAIGPGEPAQPIHRDQWAFDFFPFPSGYEVQCNTIWAMTDFTEENGATRLVPGSHKFEDRLELSPEQTVPAEMPAGSVLFYTGKLYHGAGANRSNTTRTGINITYAVSWVRQEENQYLSVSADVARSLPEPLLRLMGYARGAYALGYVD